MTGAKVVSTRFREGKEGVEDVIRIRADFAKEDFIRFRTEGVNGQRRGGTEMPFGGSVQDLFGAGPYQMRGWVPNTRVMHK